MSPELRQYRMKLALLVQPDVSRTDEEEDQLTSDLDRLWYALSREDREVADHYSREIAKGVISEQKFFLMAFEELSQNPASWLEIVNPENPRIEDIEEMISASQSLMSSSMIYTYIFGQDGYGDQVTQFRLESTAPSTPPAWECEKLRDYA